MQEHLIENDAIASTVSSLRAAFNSGKTRPLSHRLQVLAALGSFIREQEREIQRALKEDLGKPQLESSVVEISFARREVEYIRKRLKRWTKPERVPTSLIAQPGRSYVYREPLGVVLVIGAWNYPIQLTLTPLAGALAAGNCVVLKPSEVAASTSALLAHLLPKYLGTDTVRVVEGGAAETTLLLAEKFDHIFYTGNGTVGRIVMAAAAKHLTPVTLELGGKSPCIVDRHTDVPVAARRIVWGKYMNAGQTCVAPDYVLVHAAVEQQLLSEMKKAVLAFYGADPSTSPDYARIINTRHVRRLQNLLHGSGDILVGGEVSEPDKYLAPTILYNVPPDARVMNEEVFGPILPVMKVESMDEAIAFVNDRPKPLSLYLFSHDRAVQKRVLENTSSGALLVNHTCMHATVPNLPFGGVGASGMGAYHGKLSFETFSHRKAFMVKPTLVDPRIVYPPYTTLKQKLLKMLM